MEMESWGARLGRYTRKVREETNGDMDILVTHRCKMGCGMWDMRIESHRRWLLHARACISCNGDALHPSHTLFNTAREGRVATYRRESRQET